MIRDLNNLAATFEAAAGPCPDRQGVIAGLKAVFAEIQAPRTENEIRKRRLAVKAAPFFRVYQKETGVTQAEICAPSTSHGGGVDPLTIHRDALIARLIESQKPKFGVREIGQIVGRAHTAVTKAYSRHQARAAEKTGDAAAIDRLRSCR